MPIVSLKLRPGVNVEFTPTLNESGISDCNLIRFKSGLPQKLGGWNRFYPGALNGIPRDVHAWTDLEETNHLTVGTTSQLAIITDGVLTDITPQQFTTNQAPNFTTTIGSAVVQIVDAGTTNLTTLDSVFFNTPVAVGGLILSGMYPVSAIIDVHTYQIIAANNATSSVSNGGVVPIFDTTEGDGTIKVTLPANGMAVDKIVVFQIPTVVGGLTVNGSYKVSLIDSADQFSITGPNHATSTATVTMNSGNAQLVYYITLGPKAIGTGYGTELYGGVVITGAVSLTYHAGLLTITRAAGSFVADGFNGGMSIIVSGTVSNNGTYVLDSVSALTLTLIMSSVLVDEGPVTSSIVGDAIGWGGIGITAIEQTGPPITPVNWSSDNWGEIWLGVPFGGAFYYYPPTGSVSAKGHVPGGLTIAGNVANAPTFNNGMFIAQPAQIAVCWGSSDKEDIGELQDPNLIRWSDQLDFSNWVDSTTTQSGAYRVPTGSKIMGGIQATQQALIFTDIDLYSMVYQGPPLIFGFNKIGSGCGLIGQHAVAQGRGLTFWMSSGDFYVLGGSGVQPLPCSVWDYVFQDLDSDNAYKCTAGFNSLYNEVRFDFPSISGGTGEPDKYVKFNVQEQSWDKGYNVSGLSIARSAWTDQSVLGQPIGAAPDTRLVYQHEVSLNADGAAMPYFWETGYFVIAEGQMLNFVDWILPDMKFGQEGGPQNATVLVVITVVDYPNGPAKQFGPFTMTAAKIYINCRLRGRQIKLKFYGADLDSFARQGNMRFRSNGDGRR